MLLLVRRSGAERMDVASELAVKLSIIIANYNYCAFIGAAIESALAVDWSKKEVVVVDDHSTDDSRNVIESFAGRVAAYFRPKSHQLGAHMFGFEQSSGDVIIFLDSDDLLEPEVMQEVVKVWRPGVSQVQYRMNVIDAAGSQLGTAIPQFPRNDDPKKLRDDYRRTMAYTTPPGSGSAYGRDFVTKAFAIPVPVTVRYSDSLLHAIAPMFGDVLTIRKPLARYRVHGAGNGASGSLPSVNLRRRLELDIEKARVFKVISNQYRLPFPRDPLRYNLPHLQNRLASYLAEPAAHPFPEDTMSGLLYRLISSLTRSSQMPLRDRVMLLAWAIACVLAPRHYRRTLILWRFAGTSRPARLRKLLGALSSVRSTRLPDRAGDEVSSN
jgi:glycosyltransferase involved in cell wall biosynthesis